MTRPSPVTLDAALEIVDPEQRLAAITAWLERAEALAVKARLARLDAVRELRARPRPMPWPKIVRLAGIGESYLRSMIK